MLTGYPCFLGHHGEIEQNPYNIQDNEYRVFLGEATAEDTININIHEATLNSPVSEVVSALYPLVYLKDANWTMTNSDLSKSSVTVQYDLSSSGSVTLTLPSASSLNTGSIVYVQVVDDNDDVTIANHGLGYTIKLEGLIGSYAQFQSDGIYWRLLGYLDSGESNNKWQKYSDGTVRQWGTGTVTMSSSEALVFNKTSNSYLSNTPTITYDIPHVTSVPSIVISPHGNSTGSFTTRDETITTFEPACRGGVNSGDMTYKWISLGRWRS